MSGTDSVNAPTEAINNKQPDQPAQAGTEPQTPQAIKRRYKENTTFFSDLFKLGVNFMLQWKGYKRISMNAPRDEAGNLNDDWFLTEHCHYFHTTDSNGRVQEYCQPVGQHQHKMEVIRDPKNPQDIIEVRCASGPLKWVVSEKYGKRKKVLELDPHDNHVHEIFYLKSDKLSRPNMNIEAVKVVGRAQSAGTSKAVFDDDGNPLGKLEVK